METVLTDAWELYIMELPGTWYIYQIILTIFQEEKRLKMCKLKFKKKQVGTLELGKMQ